MVFEPSAIRPILAAVESGEESGSSASMPRKGHGFRLQVELKPRRVAVSTGGVLRLERQEPPPASWRRNFLAAVTLARAVRVTRTICCWHRLIFWRAEATSSCAACCAITTTLFDSIQGDSAARTRLCAIRARRSLGRAPERSRTPWRAQPFTMCVKMEKVRTTRRGPRSGLWPTDRA
jgi:hypothetical protein